MRRGTAGRPSARGWLGRRWRQRPGRLGDDFGALEAAWPAWSLGADGGGAWPGALGPAAGLCPRLRMDATPSAQ